MISSFTYLPMQKLGAAVIAAFMEITSAVSGKSSHCSRTVDKLVTEGIAYLEENGLTETRYRFINTPSKYLELCVNAGLTIRTEGKYEFVRLNHGVYELRYSS